MRLLLLATMLGLAGPALAAPIDGDWDCKAGRASLGRLTIDGEHYTLGDGSGDLAPEADNAASTVLDGPLAELWHVSRLLLEAPVLRLQVAAMYAPRAIGNCARVE